MVTRGVGDENDVRTGSRRIVSTAPWIDVDDGAQILELHAGAGEGRDAYGSVGAGILVRLGDRGGARDAEGQ